MEIETRLANQSEKFEECQRVADIWRTIFKAVTGIENHGSKKGEGQSWKSFFEQVGGHELTEYPAIFNSIDLGFDEMLMNLSPHVRNLELSLASITKRKLLAETSLQKKMKSVENKKNKDEKRVTEFLDSELQQGKADALKILCLCFEDFLRCTNQAPSTYGDIWEPSSSSVLWCFVSVFL